MSSTLPPPSPLDQADWDGSALLRYLPSWIRLGSEDSTPLLETFFGSIPAMDRLYSLLDAFSGNGSLYDTALGATRLAWAFNTSKTYSTPTITIKTSSDSNYVTIRRSISTFDFITAPDPVFSIDSGIIYFRNLAQLQDDVSVVSGTVSASSGTFMEDEDVYVNHNNLWYKVIQGDSQLNTSGSTLTIYTTSTTASVRYQSNERLLELEDPCLYIDGSGPLSIYTYDLWNIFDEHALRVGLTRLPNETNSDLRSRIQSIYNYKPNVNKYGLLTAIGRHIGLIGFIDWDGTSDLDFSAAGLSGITYAIVNELPEVTNIEEEILSRVTSGSNTVYMSKYNDWLPGWTINLYGSTITDDDWPYPSISGNILSFTENLTGNVTASYSYNNYTLETTGTSSFLRTTSNTVSGNYTVTYIKDIEINSAIDDTYQRLSLLTIDGIPNEDYLRLANNTREGIPVIIGSAIWGSKSYWFEDIESKPLIDNIPIVLK